MGIPPEDLELAKRRSDAIVLVVIGIILILAGPFLCYATGYTRQTACGPTKEPNWGVFAIVEILGWSILVYGAYLWEKVRHITWTKQALREYETEKLKIQREVRERPPSTATCPHCGGSVTLEDEFCKKCGFKLKK